MFSVTGTVRASVVGPCFDRLEYIICAPFVNNIESNFMVANNYKSRNVVCVLNDCNL